MISKLFVVGFPREMQETALLELFSLHGDVAALNIVRDKTTGSSLGYGFVEMGDQMAAERAIAALNGLKIGDRTIGVRYVDKRPAFKAAEPLKKKRPRRQIS
ncbi:RNA-binding protein [Mucilaginibacter corticis]|uniref:RNA-binding protein n=1 Tax=Mucilaginibacter corticis TaxID=2597670 RepID=A0A556MM18_9SPHI|nr:RNA-binding protein [Mucilaginibacter corticis]TSJ40966.1 RNA-binding protein [Mucilaginibacter corticis]